MSDFDAIFQDGSFRPLGEVKIPLPEGTRVRLSVDPLPEDSPINVLDLGAQVYAELTRGEIDEIERIATDRSSFFSR